MNTFRSAAMLCMVLITLLAACSSEPEQSATVNSEDAGGFEVSLGGDSFSGGQDVGIDVGAQDAGNPQDTAAADTTASLDTSEADTSWPDDLGSGLPFDVAQPDVQYEALKVVSHTPDTDGLSSDLTASFSIKFSAALNEQSVADYTVQVTGPGNITIPGVFTAKGDTAQFKADKAINPASRVDVTVGLQVQSAKGEGLKEAYTFHFYTPGYEDVGTYAALAARYAPTVRQGLGKNGALDLLRSLNYDGDWDANNNLTNVANHPAKAVVGWDVAETQSHFYIHYVFYWAARVDDAGSASHANDTAGATVVVQRYPTETPIALETWFHNGVDERRWLWVTQESGLVPSGKKPEAYNVRAVLPLNSLFPTSTNNFGCDGKQDCTARRFEGYLSGSRHESCLWQDGGTSPSAPCAKDASTLAAMTQIKYIPGTQATAAEAKGMKPSETLPEFTYGLQRLFDTWYPRRAASSLFLKPVTYTYKAPTGRPKGDQTAMGSKFEAGAANHGRPPWAWRWKPSNNVSYYDLPRGTIFLDPAFALWSRIGGSTAGLKDYDPATKVGWSLGYCFAPMLFIDQRQSKPCGGPGTTP